MKNRKYNDQTKKGKKECNDLQSTTQKSKDWAPRTPRTPLKKGVNSDPENCQCTSDHLY